MKLSIRKKFKINDHIQEFLKRNSLNLCYSMIIALFIVVVCTFSNKSFFFFDDAQTELLPYLRQSGKAWLKGEIPFIIKKTFIGQNLMIDLNRPIFLPQNMIMSIIAAKIQSLVTIANIFAFLNTMILAFFSFKLCEALSLNKTFKIVFAFLVSINPVYLYFYLASWWSYAYGYTWFMAGLAYFLGVRQLGASIVRVGAGIPELQWDSIRLYKSTYLIAVPSFLLKMIAYAEKNGIDYEASSVKGVVCIGESLRNQDFSNTLLAEKIAEKWKGIKLYSTYASTEMSTTFTECEYQQGGHHHPELIITEVLDDAGNRVGENESGELTITTLGVEAMPLVRFRTGDIVTMHTGTCACGRNTARVSPVLGRKQQMIKYKGTTLYPPVLMDLLTNFEEIENYIIEISTNSILTDEILIRIGTRTPTEALKERISNHFRAKIRVVPKIEYCDIAILERELYPLGSRKPMKFIDKRKG